MHVWAILTPKIERISGGIPKKYWDKFLKETREELIKDSRDKLLKESIQEESPTEPLKVSREKSMKIPPKKIPAEISEGPGRIREAFSEWISGRISKENQGIPELFRCASQFWQNQNAVDRKKIIEWISRTVIDGIWKIPMNKYKKNSLQERNSRKKKSRKESREITLKELGKNPSNNFRRNN